MLAINAGHTTSDFGLVDSLASTMKDVFPNVYILDVPTRGSAIGNSLVIGTKQATHIENFNRNLGALSSPVLRGIGESAQNVREVKSSFVVWTDDWAPVEGGRASHPDQFHFDGVIIEESSKSDLYTAAEWLPHVPHLYGLRSPFPRPSVTALTAFALNIWPDPGAVCCRRPNRRRNLHPAAQAASWTR